MCHCKQLFVLKCEDRDSFLAFYSQFKMFLFKLEKVNLIAMIGAIFLRVYFAKVIEVPELQTEVKKVLKVVLLSMIQS